MNKKIDINNDIARVGVLNYMLLAHYIGFIESMKYTGNSEYFKNKKTKGENKNVNISIIIDNFSEKYNVFNVSKDQLRRILNDMILNFDNKGFFGCKG